MQVKLVGMFFLFMLADTASAQADEKIILSEDLHIIPLSEHIFIHSSFTSIEPYGRFSSNGLIYVSDKKCVIFDTPVTLELSKSLLNWLTMDMGLDIQAVVVNHFHSDCLAGLAVFHQKGIPSWSSTRTQELAQNAGEVVPGNGFRKRKTLRFQGQKILLFYPGEAHTIDNIVAWIPTEKTLFGGCMVKSMGAGKGNLADANETEWSKTVEKLKNRFPSAKQVIPGHGKAGGTELLDFTISLFAN
ncbi:MAG: subclass B1 metallo-beta-lactamase [Saprospiraceae bacterium]|nr:subclass B1 metallo-beta-lactamase [Saprospiraceae bacterium]